MAATLQPDPVRTDSIRFAADVDLAAAAIVDVVLLRVAISPPWRSRRSSLTPAPVSGRGDRADR
jgi:hypothetical protein